MSLTKYRALMAAFGLALVSMLSSGAPTFGQADPKKEAELKKETRPEDEPEEGRFRTVDGLRLYYQWYAGGKGQKSDCVMLIPNYGSDISKGPWTTLARALQKQGYSVLLFDLRGHGKSADFKTMDKPDLFCSLSYNKFAGQGLNQNTIKELKKEKFSPSYYPYLVNDLAGARRFLDEQNDAGQCNSGRIFVVAEQAISPLVMLWISTEFYRPGFGPKTRLDEPDIINAGEDLCGVVFLSWGALPPGAAAANSITNTVMQTNQRGSISIKIGSQVRKKVAMAFIYGKDDKASAAEAHKWFSSFGIPGKNEDPELVKYIREVPGAEKIAGIKLLDIMEKPKDKEEKVSILENKIIEFFKTTKTKGISGNNWKERKVENLMAFPVPLDRYGLRLP